MGSSGLDGQQRFSPTTKVQINPMPRTYSGPVNFESPSSLDRPMRLSEIHVAAEHALKDTITDPELLKSLSSLEEFEVNMLSLPQVKLICNVELPISFNTSSEN